MSTQKRDESPHRWRAPVLTPDRPGVTCPRCERRLASEAALERHVEREHGARLAASYETHDWLGGDAQ